MVLSFATKSFEEELGMITFMSRIKALLVEIALTTLELSVEAYEAFRKLRGCDLTKFRPS